MYGMYFCFLINFYIIFFSDHIHSFDARIWEFVLQKIRIRCRKTIVGHSDILGNRFELQVHIIIIII